MPELDEDIKAAWATAEILNQELEDLKNRMRRLAQKWHEDGMKLLEGEEPGEWGEGVVLKTCSSELRKCL